MSIVLQAGLFGAGVAVGAFAAVQASRPSPPASTSARSDAGPSSSATALEARITNQLFSPLNPGPVSDILQRTAYVAAYDRQKRHPAWTAEHLTAATLLRTPSSLPLPPTASASSSSPLAEALVKSQEDRQAIPRGDRANSVFREDPEVPTLFRARLEDYFRSGYDRGHMVPAADAKRSQEAMDETFLLTNIAPQVGDGFNRHYWAYVEDFCRRLTGSFSDVYVFTVPLYLPKLERDGKWRVTYEVIGAQSGAAPSVAVPTHFAKVILGAKPASPATPTLKDTSIGAFVLPNALIPDETPLQTFRVPVEAVERAAGLTLFDDLTKASSKDLCANVQCEVIVRRFDDAQKKLGGGSRRGSFGTPKL